MTRLFIQELELLAIARENRARRKGWTLVAAILVMGLTFLAGYLVTP